LSIKISQVIKNTYAFFITSLKVEKALNKTNMRLDKVSFANLTPYILFMGWYRSIKKAIRD